MPDGPKESAEAMAARIVAALMEAGLLDARFEDEAIRVVTEAIR